MDLLKILFDWVCDNPGKSLLVLGAGLATGGAAWAFAGPIAATIGSTGALGVTATTGVEIATLTGAALESASLAALGGGALSVGGGGVALGTTVVAAGGAATGTTAATISFFSPVIYSISRFRLTCIMSIGFNMLHTVVFIRYFKTISFINDIYWIKYTFST